MSADQIEIRSCIVEGVVFFSAEDIIQDLRKMAELHDSMSNDLIDRSELLKATLHTACARAFTAEADAYDIAQMEFYAQGDDDE